MTRFPVRDRNLRCRYCGEFINYAQDPTTQHDPECPWWQKGSMHCPRCPRGKTPGFILCVECEAETPLEHELTRQEREEREMRGGFIGSGVCKQCGSYTHTLDCPAAWEEVDRRKEAMDL